MMLASSIPEYESADEREASADTYKNGAKEITSISEIMGMI